MEAKLQASKDKHTQASSQVLVLRSKLDEANKEHSLASQKLEALRVQQEQLPPDAPAACPAPAGPTLAPPAPPSQAPATLQHIASACNPDNMSQDAKAQMEVLAQGLDPEQVKKLMQLQASITAQSIAQQLQAKAISSTQVAEDPSDEEKCQYNGTEQQLAAWNNAMASYAPTAAAPPTTTTTAASTTAATAAATATEEALPQSFEHDRQDAPAEQLQQQQEATNAMDTTSDRQPAVKRNASFEEFGDEFATEEAAAEELIGPASPTEAGPSATKKAKPDEDSKQASFQSAIDLVSELGKQFPTHPTEASSVDLGAAASASGSSAG